MGGKQEIADYKIDEGDTSTVIDKIAEKICFESAIEGDLPGGLLDDAIRNGRVRLWGQQRDVSGIVDEVLQEHEHGLLRELQRRLDKAATVDRVLIVGGGAKLSQRLAGQLRTP